MAETPGQEQLRQELHELDDQIAEQRRTIAELRAQVGGDDAGPQDAEDVAAILTNIEEIEGILEGLEERRTAIRKELGEGS
jgi:chromosome segregation ATPase